MYTNNNTDTFNAPNFGTITNKDIDEILRGEISATEAYSQVLESISDDPEVYRLVQLRLDHENALMFWRKEARMSGKIPESTSSIWGEAVEAFVGVSKLFGEDTALLALKRGEEHGLSSYESMLESELISSFQKEEIRNTFIPRQRRHIKSIDNLLKQK